jgi:hypothetical protein
MIADLEEMMIERLKGRYFSSTIDGLIPMNLKFFYSLRIEKSSAS